MDKAKQASIELAVAWESSHAAHTDRYFFDKIDFWRDLLPGGAIPPNPTRLLGSQRTAAVLSEIK